jgi:putative transposase
VPLLNRCGLVTEEPADAHIRAFVNEYGDTMARLARIIVPGVPHHVTQRGNRREPIFFEPGDQDVYRDLLATHCTKAGVEVWAYCFMPNHVHVILAPREATGLARAVGDAHRRYTTFINARAGWSGHLFQSRFASVTRMRRT